MKIFSDLKRVFHVRDENNIIVNNDADIVFQSGYNSSFTTGSMTINFNKVFDYVAIRFNTGENANRINKYNSVSAVTKNYNSNEDYNGIRPVGQGSWDKNHIYMSDLSLVSLTVTTTTVNVYVNRIILNKVFSNLLKISFRPNGNGIGGDKSYIDSSLALNAPNLRGLEILGDITVSDDFVEISSLPNLRWLSMLGTRNVTSENYFSILPSTLEFLNFRYVGAKVMDLKDWFTGNRMGIVIQPANYPENSVLKYTGGAIFPSAITEHPLFPIPYIVYQENTVGTKISADQLSQFLIDFANQVTSVTLVNKRIRFRGSTPNTSYTDTSAPTYKTYSSALAYITGTLGVTVQFT